jgi:hypothetical protein
VLFDAFADFFVDVDEALMLKLSIIDDDPRSISVYRSTRLSELLAENLASALLLSKPFLILFTKTPGVCVLEDLPLAYLMRRLVLFNLTGARTENI